MMKDIFFIVQDPQDTCHDMIYHKGGTLKIKVWCIQDENFETDDNEVQFFGDNNGRILAFETLNYNYEEPGLIIEAIRWYACYINNPEMEILPVNPSYKQ